MIFNMSLHWILIIMHLFNRNDNNQYDKKRVVWRKHRKVLLQLIVTNVSWYRMVFSPHTLFSNELFYLDTRNLHVSSVFKKYHVFYSGSDLVHHFNNECACIAETEMMAIIVNCFIYNFYTYMYILFFVHQSEDKTHTLTFN